jgi:hypothetical protein
MSEMLQDRATSIEGHERFIRRVVEAGEVWGLKSRDGWAVCPSNQFEDARVMPFWSDRAYARRAAKEEWADYEPTSLGLEEFLEGWLREMHEDGTLVGTNWDANNCGLEVEALDLAKELLERLEASEGPTD